MISFAASGEYYSTLCFYSVFTLFILGNTYSFLTSPTERDTDLLLMRTVNNLKLLQHTVEGLIQKLLLFAFFYLLRIKNPKRLKVHPASGPGPVPLLLAPLFRLARYEISEVVDTNYLHLP